MTYVMCYVMLRRPEKKAKNHLTLTRKSLWKSCSTAHMLFLTSNPKILKVFPKTHPTECSLLNAQQKKPRRRVERKRKGKVKTAVSLLNPTTLSKICFLCMHELKKLIFQCFWIRRPKSVWPANGVVLVSFSSWEPDSNQKTARLASKHVF